VWCSVATSIILKTPYRCSSSTNKMVCCWSKEKILKVRVRWLALRPWAKDFPRYASAAIAPSTHAAHAARHAASAAPRCSSPPSPHAACARLFIASLIEAEKCQGVTTGASTARSKHDVRTEFPRSCHGPGRGRCSQRGAEKELPAEFREGLACLSPASPMSQARNAIAQSALTCEASSSS
jgi:hypothetical protein